MKIKEEDKKSLFELYVWYAVFLIGGVILFSSIYAGIYHPLANITFKQNKCSVIYESAMLEKRRDNNVPTQTIRWTIQTNDEIIGTGCA